MSCRWRGRGAKNENKAARADQGATIQADEGQNVRTGLDDERIIEKVRGASGKHLEICIEGKDDERICAGGNCGWAGMLDGLAPGEKGRAGMTEQDRELVRALRCIVHRWLYRIKKAYGSGNIGLKWALLRRTNGTFWVQGLLWGNAMDGEAENLWGEYGDVGESTELSNPEKKLVCSAWARRISEEEIEGGALWKI